MPVYATRQEIEHLLLHSDAIEELRRATDSPHVFTHDLMGYQGRLIQELQSAHNRRARGCGCGVPTRYRGSTGASVDRAVVTGREPARR